MKGCQKRKILKKKGKKDKKRGESHHFESNGSSGKTTCNFIIDSRNFFYLQLVHELLVQLSCFEGFCGQPNSKKPKIMRQSLDNPLDNIVSMTNSIPSPVASQMSNMSNPNKFIKIISGRDRGRKAKALKVNFDVKLDAHMLANFLSVILLILLFIFIFSY